MTLSKATIGVRHADGAASIIDVQGDLNAAAEGALLDAYAQAADRGARAIILNLSRMEYMNSSGIGLLVRLLIRTNQQQQKLLIYGVSEHYRQVFARTRLNEVLGVYDSEGEALAEAGRLSLIPGVQLSGNRVAPAGATLPVLRAAPKTGGHPPAGPP